MSSSASHAVGDACGTHARHRCRLAWGLQSLLIALLLRSVSVAGESGDYVSGTIASSGVTNAHPFEATAGDVVRAKIAFVSGDATFWPKMSFHTASGIEVASAGGNASHDVVQFTVGAAGVATIRCSGNGGATGTYGLSAVRFPGRALGAGDPDVGVIGNGDTIAGSIAGPGDLDLATFYARPGDRFFLAMAALPGTSSGPSVRIYSPQGSFISGASSTKWIRTWGQASIEGWHTVVCEKSGLGTGAYNLSFLHTTGGYPLAASDSEIGVIRSGEPYGGSIEVCGDFDAAFFVAASGTTVNVTMTEVDGTSLRPSFYVYDPAGRIIGQDDDYLEARDTFDVTRDGVHIVACSGYSQETGSYRLAVSNDTPEDADNDGLSNVEEMMAWTDPFDATSCLRIQNITATNGGMPTIQWSSVGGMSYRVQRCDDLRGMPFSDIVRSPDEEVEDDVSPGDPHVETFVPLARTNGARAYRILSTPADMQPTFISDPGTRLLNNKR